jgi:ribosomal protein S12 methylthiotransferase
MQWGIEALRKKVRGVTLRTTVIVGFPGETETEFRDLMDFLKEARFERLGAFKYSDEDGARSFAMDEKIPDAVKEDRFRAVMEQQARISREIQRKFVGQTLKVLIDEKDAQDSGIFYGRTEADAPEVDGQVIVHSETPLTPGDFEEVRIMDALEYDLVGQAG